MIQEMTIKSIAPLAFLILLSSTAPALKAAELENANRSEPTFLPTTTAPVTSIGPILLNLQDGRKFFTPVLIIFNKKRVINKILVAQDILESDLTPYFSPTDLGSEASSTEADHAWLELNKTLWGNRAEDHYRKDADIFAFYITFSKPTCIHCPTLTSQFKNTLRKKAIPPNTHIQIVEIQVNQTE